MSLHQQLLDLSNKENSQRVEDLLRALKEAALNGQYSLPVKKQNLDLCRYLKLCHGLNYGYEGDGYVIFWDFPPQSS